MNKLPIEQTTETVDSVSASMRSCKSCVHSAVCEARRTLYRSFKQFDNEFGDMVDIGVIHTEEKFLRRPSCKIMQTLSIGQNGPSWRHMQMSCL